MKLPGIVIAFFLVSFPFSAALAQDVTTEDTVAIQNAIASQLDAFRRDDGPAAYEFAAVPIRKLFPTIEIFMTMVRRGYPQIYRARESTFKAPTRTNGVVWQIVTITGDDGETIEALYQMVKQPDGVWRINSVRTRPAAGAKI
jgi:hypothetical protein